MKRLPFLLGLAFASCAAPSSVSKGGKEVYRYVNTLDFGNDNRLDRISVTGTDESKMLEATRLDVSVGEQSLVIRDPYDGTAGGALYNPSVELGKDGSLVISWSRIGETRCRAEIVSDASGRLVERRRTVLEP